MSDLIKRLRAFAEGETGTQHSLNDIDKAADRISGLESEREMLKDTILKMREAFPYGAKEALEREKTANSCLNADNSALLEALERVRPFVRHMSDCEVGSDDVQYADLCTCGLAAIKGEKS